MKTNDYLYENPIIRKKMGKNAFILANKNFNSIKNAKQVLQMYSELLISQN